MKRALTASVLALLPFCVLAQRAPTLNGALTNFATRSLAKCPEAKITIEPVGREGPSGFVLYQLSQESSDPSCQRDRKSTRLNSSHRCISYAVFCLKKKN